MIRIFQQIVKIYEIILSNVRNKLRSMLWLMAMPVTIATEANILAFDRHIFLSELYEKLIPVVDSVNLLS